MANPVITKVKVIKIAGLHKLWRSTIESLVKDVPITVPIPISKIVLVPIGHSAISTLPLMLNMLAPIRAPARGATVTIKSNKRIHSKTIDAGSGYLCQMEPVAHYGIRKGEKDFKVEIKWTDGSIESFDIDELNKTYEFRQKL